MPSTPEIDLSEIKIAPESASADANADVGEQADANAQDALGSIADNLSLIQKHLFALLYLAHTWRPEVTGVTYVHEIFQAIYTEGDPFKEVDDLLARLKADNEANKAKEEKAKDARPVGMKNAKR
jgi:hypothetical protein